MAILQTHFQLRNQVYFRTFLENVHIKPLHYLAQTLKFPLFGIFLQHLSDYAGIHLLSRVLRIGRALLQNLPNLHRLPTFHEFIFFSGLRALSRVVAHIAQIAAAFGATAVQVENLISQKLVLL